MMKLMESQVADSYFSASKRPRSLVFMIDFTDPRAIEPVTSEGRSNQSIVVRIEEPEYVHFAWTVAEATGATGTFAEALARQTAFLAIEKDFPNGVEPALSAQQIDHMPPEYEDRLPDLCVNGNNVWFVDPRIAKAELQVYRSSHRHLYSSRTERIVRAVTFYLRYWAESNIQIRDD